MEAAAQAEHAPTLEGQGTTDGHQVIGKEELRTAGKEVPNTTKALNAYEQEVTRLKRELDVVRTNYIDLLTRQGMAAGQLLHDEADHEQRAMEYRMGEIERRSRGKWSHSNHELPLTRQARDARVSYWCLTLDEKAACSSLLALEQELRTLEIVRDVMKAEGNQGGRRGVRIRVGDDRAARS